jgi:hypothetical protein
VDRARSFCIRCRWRLVRICPVCSSTEILRFQPPFRGCPANGHPCVGCRLEGLHAQSSDALRTQRMPTTRNEDFRFTDISAVLKSQLQVQVRHRRSTWLRLPDSLSRCRQPSRSMDWTSRREAFVQCLCASTRLPQWERRMADQLPAEELQKAWCMLPVGGGGFNFDVCLLAVACQI